ncbi:AAA family ATPase [Candidatus Woesearchaeota archaeon]|nr:AAA family ATPase [Candidatus Woesearchaeota archaeon]
MAISSGNKDFDEIINGGYDNCITTFYGSAGTGKTTFCLMAAIEQTKYNNKVIFIDTESNFSIERIKIICQNKLENILGRIILFKVKSFKIQQDQIKNLFNLINVGNFSLIIVDSIGHYYRSLVKKKPDLANKMLISQLKMLKKISEKQPVVITNQVYTDIDKNIVRMLGRSIVGGYSTYIINLDKSDRRKLIVKKPLKRESFFQIVDQGIKILK